MRFFKFIALIVVLASIVATGCSPKASLRAADEAFSRNQYQRAIVKYKKAYTKAKAQKKGEKDE